MNKSRLLRSVQAAMCAALILTVPVLSGESEDSRLNADKADSRIAYEVVGQVLNVSPQQSLQYGYLNYVRGLARIASQPGPISETTALLTFYNDTTTERVINNGPVRLIDRTGTGTIYFDESGLASFVNPDTFKDGKAAQVCTLRHQVFIDTSTGYFSTTFEMTVISVATFEIDGQSYRLGNPGDVYRVMVSGKLNPAGPPSAYIAGLAMGVGAEAVAVNH